MHALTNWFIRNPVAANLVMAVILIAGALSLWGMRIEGFPRLPPDTVTVTVDYPGASAEQVDDSITRKLEGALEGLPGAQKIFSVSLDDQSQVRVQKKDGYLLARLLDDIELRINNIATLPRDAERPIVQREEFDFPAMIVQVYGSVDQHSLQRLARLVKQELLAQPEISQLKQWGERSYEMSITLLPERLQALDLTLEKVATAMQASSLQYRTGLLKTDGGRVQLRADRYLDSRLDFEDIVVLDQGSGMVVRLGDIAEIENGFVDDEIHVLFQGEPAIGFEILIGQNDNLLDVSRVTQNVIERLREQFPDAVKLDSWADQSDYISERLSTLRSNALQGLALVFILLALFLSPKLAFWVALGIPISLAGTMAVMGWDYFDYSLNDITTFGMIIVLGVLVDDAVVVGESIYSERRRNPDPILGTEAGVARVATATIFGVLTTVAAFLPMTTIQNPLGKVLASFAVVVIIALLFSLFESKFILPAHLAGTTMDSGNRASKRGLGAYWLKLQISANAQLDAFNARIYRPLLERCITYRYAALIGFVAVATLAIGLITVGAVRITFFPVIPGSVITVDVEMDKRASLEMTLANTAALRESLDAVNTRFAEDRKQDSPPVAKLMTAVLGPGTINAYAELAPETERSAGTLQILDAWRNQVGNLEGAAEIRFSGSEETGGGFTLEVFSSDEDVLQLSTARISATLRQRAGVSDVRDDFSAGKPEIRLGLKPEGRALGITAADLATQIGDAFGGLEVQRFQRGTDEVKVMVRVPDRSRDSLHDLLTVNIQLPDGTFVPVLALAELESHYVPDVIWRRNFQRAATISAIVDKQTTSSKDVFTALEDGVIAELVSTYPGLTVNPAGELEEEVKMQRGFIKALTITLVLIYVLLAIPLKNYWQPLVIMSVIPFGFVGAAVGHMIVGIPLSILSFFGMLALTGVVVNDSLVMMTRYNQFREQGLPEPDALVEAGSSRLRAIFLTTVTTVAGLSPLMLETSEQAQYLIPAAVSLAFGEIFATAITLLIVPTLTAIGHDIGGLLRGKKARSTITTTSYG